LDDLFQRPSRWDERETGQDELARLPSFLSPAKQKACEEEERGRNSLHLCSDRQLPKAGPVDLERLVVPGKLLELRGVLMRRRDGVEEGLDGSEEGLVGRQRRSGELLEYLIRGRGKVESGEVRTCSGRKSGTSERSNGGGGRGVDLGIEDGGAEDLGKRRLG
jgi:hypothetical protein